ncbi:hypothetical protein [Cellulophaga sp. Z1A5H]|uniref:hypothetical protein n=1 Tax=Cellulophaga sp. Z1A5H TaxID=2687291 RepID=UPI0013FE1627|nr:hypothetical protein [Cellulophaga sp. Z1A5H]
MAGFKMYNNNWYKQRSSRSGTVMMVMRFNPNLSQTFLEAIFVRLTVATNSGNFSLALACCDQKFPILVANP